MFVLNPGLPYLFLVTCSFKSPFSRKKRKRESSLSLLNLFCLPHKSGELNKNLVIVYPGPVKSNIQYPISFGGFFGLTRWQFAGASERLGSPGTETKW